MAGLSPQQSLIFQPWAEWLTLRCLPADERVQRGFSAPCGHLSDNSYIETALQGLLLFGPPVFLIIGAPVKIFQLYGAKLVTLPNYRGLIKLVSFAY